MFPCLASLAAEYKASLIVLHVARPEDKGAADENGKEILCAQTKKFFFPRTDPRCQLDLIVDRGNPVAKILEHAKAHRADLIGFGVPQPDEALLTHFRQTVTYRVVLEAECPVLTFHDLFDILFYAQR